MNQLFRPLPCLFVAAVLAATSSHALATARHKLAPHERKTETGATGNEKAALNKKAKGKHGGRVASKHHKQAPSDEKPAESATPPLTGDLAVVKNAIDLARQGKTSDATTVEKTITDPAGQKLAEWFILRHPDSQVSFSRYASFIAANPDWP